MARSYGVVIAECMRANGRVAGLWQLECAVRADRGRVDTERLMRELGKMEGAGRIERVAASADAKAAWRFRPGRR